LGFVVILVISFLRLSRRQRLELVPDANALSTRILQRGLRQGLPSLYWVGQSKQANHRYLVGATLDAIRSSFVRPRRMIFAICWRWWCFSGGVGGDQGQGSLLRSRRAPALVLAVDRAGVVVGMAALLFWQRARFRRGYLAALALPDPNGVVEHLRPHDEGGPELSGLGRHGGQSRALAFALYGATRRPPPPWPPSIGGRGRR
jgi:hypothetical protein